MYVETINTLLLYICMIFLDIVNYGLVPVTLGGDHSITNPLVIGRAAADNPSEFAIVHVVGGSLLSCVVIIFCLQCSSIIH